MDTPTVWVVERYHWQSYDEDPGGTKARGLCARLAGSTRVASFTDFDAAHADCLRREKEARANANPFALGGPVLHYQTSLSEEILGDWVREVGLEPPAAGAEGGWL